MCRAPSIASKMPDPLREAAGLPIGPDGAFYVGSAKDGNFGQTHDASVLEFNSPSRTQPGLWCKWEPNEDGTAIVWSGAEKFYDYVEWLGYLIENFLKPWGYKVNGTVKWQGEDSDDRGKIIVKDNDVTTKIGRTVYR